jgi:hypothetical protein
MLGMLLQPNESLSIPLLFASGDRSGPITTTLDVTLEGNGMKYVTQASMNCEVLSDYSFTPKAFDFGVIRPDELSSKSINFRPVALEKIELVATQTWLGPFEVRIRDQTVEVTFHAPKIEHREIFTRSLRVLTSSKRVPEVSIPINARVIPDIEVSPSILVLTDNSFSDESRLTLLTEQPSRIKRIVTNPGENKLDTAKTPGEAYWIKNHDVRINNSMLTGMERIDIELEVRESGGRIEARSASVSVKTI